VHDLRRTFATRAARAGMWPGHLQKILGHHDIKVTLRFYTHLEQADLLHAMRSLNGEKAEGES
jgi:integrase